ncbi:uracil-DNA glycosylase [Bacillota bacterium LX-D]|nr:uracil-DNA glycosylase [Bacillota bacterium LX-D]
MMKGLNELKAAIGNCTNCTLYETRSCVVMDEERERVILLLLGEAPGGHEDRISGKPFSGEAGHILTDLLEKVGLKRNQCYITNSVKCRPTKPSQKGRYGPYANRKPKVSEIKACRCFLENEISLLKPKVIATLGGVPLGSILHKSSVRLEEYHGKPFFSQEFNCYVFPLYHPASIIYRPRLGQVYEEDLNKLKIFLSNKFNEKG